MQKILMHCVIGILCLVLGYVTYPIMNGAEIAITPLRDNNNNKERSAIPAFAAANEPSVTPAMHLSSPIPASKQQNAELTVNDDESVDDGVVESRQLSAIFSANVTDDEIIGFQQELENWSAAHKEKLNDLIDAYMTNERSAAGMKTQIAKNNDFLSKPPIKHDPFEDANWAYTMEQQIAMLIAQHELSASFNVINVSCKQLLCDILGSQKTDNAWFMIYMTLLQRLPNANVDDNNGAKSVVYLENDNTTVYFQIKFKRA